MDDKFIELVQPTLAPWEEVRPFFEQVWNSGRLTLGPHTAAFEQAAADYMQVQQVVAVNSCTSGMMLVLRGLGLTGEVILPSFTWASTGHALVWNGLKPVFADITPGTWTLDPEDTARRITSQTSAILATNIFGVYPEIDALQKVADRAGVPLLCDSAQAIGATYRGRMGGGLCRAEIFSLSPTKVVTAVEGGLITTDDEKLARQLRMMRDYGKNAAGSDVELFGLSARISEFHCIIGLANFKRVEELIASRERLVGRYREKLDGRPGISFQTIPTGWRSGHNYVVLFFDPRRYRRDDIWRRMTDLKVHTKRYFYPPLHHMGAYAGFPPPVPPLPVTERVSANALALPLYSHMALEDVDLVCRRLEQAFLA